MVGPGSFAERTHRYARDVVRGKVVASRWVKLACQRHLDDLSASATRKKVRWIFDERRAHRICTFAEKCRHEKGVLQGQCIKLEDAQVFILTGIFGWVDRETGVRKHREALVMLPRGNGKSPIAAVIGLYTAFFDGEPGAETYCGANRERQAKEVFRPAQAMVDQEPVLREHYGIQVAAKSIFQPSTRSRFQPVVKKPGDGASVWCGILDELHEAKDATLYDTFKTGANKRPGSLILVISTAGVSSAENPCYQLQLKAEKVLQGIIPDERLFAVIHCADPDVDWTSPAAVEMANPLLGISNDREAILLDQQEAVRSPAKANVFKAKHLNLWSSAAAAWMNMAIWAKCFDPALKEYGVELEVGKTPDGKGILLKKLPCWIGTDLASKLDLSACVRLFRDDSQGERPHFYALCRAYLPKERVNAPENQHYQAWVAQNALTSTDGSSIDYATIENEAVADIELLDVKELPYDDRYADQWSQQVSERTGVTRTLMPPKPAVMSPAMKEVEAAVYDKRFHHDGHPVLTWCMSNILTRETAAGNYTMPDKPRDEAKIDCAVALFMSMSRARLNEAEASSWWAPAVW